MNERKLDKLLSIKTIGIREWKDNKTQYNHYEATPYKVLEILAENYNFKDVYRVVDFGCGLGRVVFYLHERFHIPVVGIEANYETYEEALENEALYSLKAKHITAPIEFQCILAEDFKIHENDNCFYFFNPFDVSIFRQVIYNILRSIEKNKRTVDLILYYPVREYRDFLKNSTPFTIVNEMKVPCWANDENEKIIIYRLEEKDF